MNSSIYIGTIEHRRHVPVNHKLSYPVYMYGFDLDDLPRLNRRYPLFGYNRFAVTAIHDKDYLYPGNQPVKQKINRLLAHHNISDPVASVMMITSARYFNYVFNPVNFYYCFSEDTKLIAIIAEVNNTYGERHPYVLTQNTDASPHWFASYKTAKVFHVSPFNKIEGSYHFYFSAPCDRLEIRIELIQEEKKIMEAILRIDAIPLTGRNHIKTVLKYPFAPHLSIPRIYSHAFKLFFRKKLAFNDKPVPESSMTIAKQTPGVLEAISRRLILTALKKIEKGCLHLTLPDQRTLILGHKNGSQTATIQVKDFNFFPRIVFDGEIGFGEAYMAGEWDTTDLVGVLKLLIDNRDQFSDGNLMLSILTRIQEKLAHDRCKNTVQNTSGNIAAHYDLSNTMYTLFLDHHMIYSCGLFLQPADTLADAQENKMQRILDQADVNSDHHLLEIGCGWGGFAVFAVKQTGCRVTGITVSKAQYDRACQRVKQEGLTDKITILLQDYRHTSGTYDRIVSIEMIEAVGPQFFKRYFKQCQTLLKPFGIMVFQAITIVDERYESYCKERDWIQKHIFPGGHLPCLKILNEIISSHTDFTVTDIYHMGPHYATTLALWRKRFAAHQEDIKQMGFDKEFFRKWIYYFSICEAGFTTSGIDDIQVTLRR